MCATAATVKCTRNTGLWTDSVSRFRLGRGPLGITGVSALARDTTMEGDYVQQIKNKTQVDRASVLVVLLKGRLQAVGRWWACGLSWG